MSKKFLKLFALLAVLTMAAGMAWATVSGGVITDAAVTQESDFTGAGAAPTDPRAGYSFSGNTVILQGDVILPTLTGSNGLTSVDSNQEAIVMGTGQVLTIRPGVAPGGAPGAAKSIKSGVLRLNGGTTNVYAAADNNPTAGTTWNAYEEGTFLRSGTLNVAHSNALGAGRIALAQGTTIGFINTDVDLGLRLPDNKSLLGKQILTLHRNDKGAVNTRAPVTFNVAAATNGTPLTFKMYSVISEDTANLQEPTPATPTLGTRIQIVKAGPGTMVVKAEGAQHTGGTSVTAGTLEVQGEGSERYVGELGLTWPEKPVEAESAKINYGPDAKDTNTLDIASGAQLIVNRDQFFGNFNGAGTFEVKPWTKANAEQIPQITVQLTKSETGHNSLFSGVVKGRLNLVLDNPVDKHSGFPYTLALTGANAITAGDTTIKDGTLSIPGSDRLGPGVIRLGLNSGSYVHNDTGLAAGTANFRGFLATEKAATLHASETFSVTQDVVVRTVSTEKFANLAADRDRVLTFNGNVELRNEAGSTNAGGNAYPYEGKALLTNAVRINHPLGINRNWLGTVSLAGFDFPGSTAAMPLGIEIHQGILHVEKPQTSGFGIVGIEQGAVFSLGENARDFTKKLDVVVVDDSRIRVIVKPGDIKTEAEARKADPIFKADRIDYTGLGTGEVAREGRLDIQLDLRQLPSSTLQKDSWFKVIGSVNAVNWNHLHFTRESSSTDDEDYAKVRLSYITDETFDGDKITAILDENTYSILVHVKETVSPTDPTPPPSTPTLQTPRVSVKSSDITVTAEILPAPATETELTFTLFNKDDTAVSGIAPKKATTRGGTATVTFSGVKNGSYTVQVSGSGYTTKFSPAVTVGGSKSGGGCSTGFAGLALLLAAPLFLRKKG
ncbi:MAG: SYNERG-CTERM sorting domain-containing protein [Synergistaceae bacterium]|nr:SYNERG-CTERM sorting domain-containing protein [Synergistaceae bacterium]